jgi:hypothetical protein
MRPVVFAAKCHKFHRLIFYALAHVTKDQAETSVF